MLVGFVAFVLKRTGRTCSERVKGHRLPQTELTDFCFRVSLLVLFSLRLLLLLRGDGCEVKRLSIFTISLFLREAMVVRVTV